MLPDGLSQAIFWAADFVFGRWTMALLLGTGLFLSLRLGFPQLTRLREAFATLRPKFPFHEVEQTNSSI